MGVDVDTYCEKMVDGKWTKVLDTSFLEDGRNYTAFGFIANIRNYCGVPHLDVYQGMPDDFQWATEDWEFRCLMWIEADKLYSFDYNQMTEDRRVTIDGNGGCTAQKGEGVAMTYQELLGDYFDKEISELRKLEVERITFDFSF